MESIEFQFDFTVSLFNIYLIHIIEKFWIIFAFLFYRLRLLANDQELGVAQADDSQSLNLNTRTLWLGGFVSKTFIEKFDGCISDVIVNGK